MSPLLVHTINHITWITLNRPEKHNAFDASLIEAMTQALHSAIANPETQVIVLKGAGKDFSAGADLTWMQQMANASPEDNEADAQKLATLLSTLYHCPKPTLACVQGNTYGGGLGLIAACDISLASNTASFCFSEVKLGLIPAIISPYIIDAIGARAAKVLFLTAASFNAEEAHHLQLIHLTVPEEKLLETTDALAVHLTTFPSQTLSACKALVRTVTGQPIDDALSLATAKIIAAQRQTEEARTLIDAFLKMKTS